MIKTKISKAAKTLLISLAVVMAAGCTADVGLGEAVDTAAPSIELSYPPKSAIIRESFVAAGTCADDIKVESVKVTVTNTSTKKAFGPYEATLNDDKSGWTIQLNQKNGGRSAEQQYDTYEAYKQWEFPDGSYIVSAVAYDRKGNASPEASVPVDIDNTAPVLLVSKPLATGAEKASVYGRTINITGDISEEHESARLVLYYKEYDETAGAFTQDKPETLEISNFGTMSSDSPLSIAKFNKSLDEETVDILHNNYLSIYGDDVDLTQSNKKLYYCGFMLEDNAKVYQNPEDEGIQEGNKTEQYYILSDSYNEELFSEDTYTLNARNLMLLLNGKSSYSEAQINKIVELLKKPGNSASSTDITKTDSTKFSVDPKNNPVWSITNFEQWNGNFTTFEPGSAVPLVLEAGGDAISVDKSSIQVELYHIGTELGPITANTPHATLVKKGTYVDGMLKDILSPQNEKTLKFYTNGSETETSVGLNVNHLYEIVVTGSDVAGNELENKDNNRYGFRRLSSFSAPNITFRSGSGAVTQNEYKKGAAVNTQGITIMGTITTADKDISVKKEDLTITNITITDVTNSNVTVSTANADEAEADDTAEVKYTYEITDFSKQDDGDNNKGKTYYFTATINKASDTARLIPATEGAFKYKITFVAKDSLEVQNEGTDFEFKVDSKAPELSDDILISPVVTKDNKTYVNGTITVTGNISDTGSGFKKLSYSIGNGEATEISDPGFHWTFDIDTTALEDNKAYVLNVYAEDTVGNSITIPCDITVDQSTDKPEISFSNKDSIFSKTSNVLVGNIKDDDGLETVTVEYKKKSPIEDENYTDYPVSITRGTSSYSLNFALPADEGEYEVKVAATDIVGLSTGSKTETVTITKDNGAPEFSITSPNATKDSYFNDAVTIKGNIKDGSGVVTLKRDVYKVAGTTETKVTDLCASETAIAGSAIEIVAGKEWTDTFPKTAADKDGTYKLVYTAKDKVGNTTEQTITFSMDVNKPSVSKVEFGGKDITTITEWFNKNYGEFLVTTNDTTSSVVKVCYTQASNPNSETAVWANMSAKDQTNNTWGANITFEGTGAKKLYIKAVDKAGNESDAKEINLKIDTVAPTLTVTDADGNALDGTIYVNKEIDKSFKATYSDDASGVEDLQFKIGNTVISGLDKVTCTKRADTNVYDITIKKAALETGLFKVIGTDKAGNENIVECCNFIVDTVAPELKDISITQTKGQAVAYKESDNKYYISRETDGKIKISGLANETYSLKEVSLEITEENGTHSYNPSSVTTANWSFDNISFAGWTNAHVIVTAKDAVDNEETKEFDIIFDETAPEIDQGEETISGKTFRGQAITVSNLLMLDDKPFSNFYYGRMTSINNIEVNLQDEGSGIAKLEYKLATVEDNPNVDYPTLLRTNYGDSQAVWAASGTFDIAEGNKARANISGFNTTASGKVNYLLLRPIDNCGNAGTVTVLKIYVDQTAPEIEAISTEQLTNGSKPIEISGSVKDDDAGLKALSVIINGNSVLEIKADTVDNEGNPVTSFTNDYGTISYTASHLFRDAPSSATWAVTLTPGEGSWFEDLDDNVDIYLQAEDWAEHENQGNIAPNPTKIAVLKIDQEKPTLTVTSPSSGTELNGINKIIGTSNDQKSSPETVEIYYKKYIKAAGATTDPTPPTKLSDYGDPWKTLTTKGENGVNVSKLYNFEFSVNFDELIADGDETQNVWILAVATDMAGNKSVNENAIPSTVLVNYTIDRNTDRPVIKLTTEGIDLSQMDVSNDKPILLKEKQVYVNITDDDGTVTKAEFRTNGQDDGWEEIELKNGSGKFSLENDGKQTVEFRITDKNGNVFTSFDNTNWKRVYIEDAEGNKLGDDEDNKPVVYTLLDMASPDVEIKGIKLSTDAATADWRQLSTFSTILGGDTKNITLKIKATDNGTGIKENGVTVELKLNETVLSSVPATLTSGTGAEPDVYTAVIPCSTGNGVLNVEVKAEDGAGRVGTSGIVQFEVDNEAPVITVDSPDEITDQSGTTTVIGYTNEAVNLYYAVSKSRTLEQNATYKSYNSQEDYSTAGFYIYFDGQNESEPNHTKKLNDWLISLGITTQVDLDAQPDEDNYFGDVTPIYLHLKAVDAAGNKKTAVRKISVDPQGERPKVEFSYPAKNVDNLTLGGTINIIGSVTGKGHEYTVYMQIDTNNDGIWNDTDKTSLISKGYEVEEIPIISKPDKKYYGIPITVDGDVWNKKINETAQNRFTGTIKIRIYAVDTSKNLISSSKTKTITIDNGLPEMDETSLKLVQWKEGKNGKNGITVTKTGTQAGTYTIDTTAVKAIRNFTDGMSVSGKWFVIGKVSSSSGISKINFDGSKDNGASLADDVLNSDDSIVIPYTDNATQKKNYIFCFPVGSNEEDAVGKSEVIFYAKDGKTENAKALEKQFNVNYDNLKPEVTELGQNLEILNDNGFYTFKSTAFEQSIGNVNQTGVERIVFYFTRDISGTDQTKLIFDPMIRNGATGNKQSYATGWTYEDKLYWKEAACSVSNNKLTLTAAPAKHVHVGGLVKVNGTIYKIAKIEGTDIILSGTPGNSTNTTAMFALANVIDNTIPEDVPINNNNLKLDSTTEYGYGYFDPAKVADDTVYDDGDLMPEQCNNVGTKTTWQASINSKNISDGPVTLHYLVFDKAGNYAYCTSTAKVQNNSPRIAGAWIGTDEDGNGKVDDGEFVSYHNKFEKGYNLSGRKVTSVTFPEKSTDSAPLSLITIKRDLVIKPEIVGGNKTVGYTYKVAKRNTAGDGWADAYYSSSSPEDLGTGTEDDDTKFVQTADDKAPEIKITVKDLLKNLKETESGPYAGDANNQKFSFTIWDSTPGLDYGTTSQSATMNVIMNVALMDSIPANNKIIPFYWKSAEKNSLKNNSSDLGHIELSADLANATNVNSLNPKVSGAVKLEGIAQDNSLLDSLYVTIPGFNNGNAVTIAEYFTLDASNNKVYGNWQEKSGTKSVGEGANATTVTMWTTHISHATYGEYRDAGYDLPTDAQGNTIVKDDDFELPYASQEYGHVVHWTMEIDTEAMGITPKAGINITVGVKDKGKPSLSGENVGYTQNTANNTDAYPIDVVPYIRGIKTMLSTKSKKADSSEYDRTALGHYPVAKTETIYLYGFNLADGTLYDSENHSASLGSAITINTYDSYKGFKLYPVSGISEFTSGPVYVKAGKENAEVESLNNKNWNDAQGSYGAVVPQPEDAGLASTRTTFSNFYNRKPNQQNNYMLTDDVILDVWNLNSQAAKPAASGAIFDPVMKINPSSGIIGFAYVSGTRRFSMANKTNSYQLWVGDYDNLSATGFAYDSDGNTYGTALGGDINSSWSNSKFAFMSSIWGTSDTSNVGTKSDSKHQRIEQIGQIGTKTSTSTNYIDKNRVQSPSIAVSGSDTNATVYLVYYDHLNQEIRFRWAANPIKEFKKKINNVNKRGFSGTNYINDNYTQNNLGSNGDYDKYNTKEFQVIAESGVTNSKALGEAGPYVSIDVIPDGGTNADNTKYDIVVITWYDKENKNLLYTYNITDLSKVTKANFEGSANTKTHWQTASTIFSNAGMYCQIQAAADGSIHFAGYDGDSGDICYAKLSRYSDTTVETCIVDSNGIVGSNLTLDVALDASGNTVPYIGYYGSSGPKMAYLSEAGRAKTSVVAGAIQDMFTGYWEVTEIPTESNAVKDRVNVGVWKYKDTVTTGDDKHVKGQIKKSETGQDAHDAEGNTSNSGSVYGNGTAYPVIGYEIRPSTDTGFMETAQMQ